MLTVQIHTDREGYSLRMTGHAGAGKKGADIVCAAASMLAYTAAGELLRLHREGEFQKPPVIRLAPGVACLQTRGCRASEAVFSMIATGFSMLAANYPEHIRLERKV